MTIGEWAARLHYRYVPDHVVGEVLGRSWMDNVIPVILLAALLLDWLLGEPTGDLSGPAAGAQNRASI